MVYKIAIPSYNRVEEITHKTLNTLKEASIDKNKIYIFVANQDQYNLYAREVPSELYHKIIIGKKGITNQRVFISNYFKPGTYVISMDDDVEQVDELKGEKLVKKTSLHAFFVHAYETLKRTKLFIWGIYPVRNPFFMYNKTTIDLRFIIGVMFGFITRHNRKLKMNICAESKEDYEQTILYYLLDGGVVRFNNITVKTKFNAVGGLGTDRFQKNKTAAEYLVSTYPDIVSRNDRKNGNPEVKLARIPRNTIKVKHYSSNRKTKKVNGVFESND
jgi:hypothetical protein